LKTPSDLILLLKKTAEDIKTNHSNKEIVIKQIEEEES
jgi:hypothetical protein